METTQTLYAAVQKCYEHLYDAITELAKHPDDDNRAMWEAIAYYDYDRALEAYVIAGEKEAKAAWDRGELPF
jgi:hypothetical protein